MTDDKPTVETADDEPRITSANPRRPTGVETLTTEEENLVIHVRGFKHDKDACKLCTQDQHLTDMFKDQSERRREIGELQRAITKRDDLLGMIHTAAGLEPRRRFGF